MWELGTGSDFGCEAAGGGGKRSEEVAAAASRNATLLSEKCLGVVMPGAAVRSFKSMSEQDFDISGSQSQTECTAW